MNEQAKNYQPLIVVLGLALAMALAVHANIQFFFFAVMNSFMGFFFCLLAMFKFFDLGGFARGFAMYDLLAKRWRWYGYLYPAIELCLGLLFLADGWPLITNSVTLTVMAISAAGVISSVSAGMNVRCACLGTSLNVPLSTVSIIETVGMGAMAALNLVCLAIR